MNLVTLLRHMQFYAHIAHNVLGGESFFQDHAFLGELYQGYESDYDDIVERMIGLEDPINLIKVQKDATADLNNPKNYQQCFANILSYEEELCATIEELSKDCSQGTLQLIGDIANKSEARQYKLKQRLK